jgi:hypothetical protein
MNLSDINFLSVCIIPLGIAVFAAFLQPFLEYRTNLFKSNEVHGQSSNRDWSRAIDIAVRNFKAIQSGFDWDAHYVKVENANFPKKGQHRLM